MAHALEPAASGRASCRACGAKIAKGELRFGERVDNPYGEGMATYWLHLGCAACKRPESLLPTLDETWATIADRERLTRWARQGIEHYRLARIAKAQRAPSGRARCRHCRETIDKGQFRIALDIWEDGRFGGMGFVHVACSESYFGTADVLDRLVYLTPDLGDDDRREIERALHPALPAPPSDEPLPDV